MQDLYDILKSLAKEFGLDTTMTESGLFMVHPPKGEDRLVHSFCCIRAWHEGGLVIENLEKKELFDIHDPESIRIIKRWFERLDKSC